jgi:acyl carrier protein
MTMAHPDDSAGTLDAQVRAILDQHGRLNVAAANLAAGADLYAAGLSSHASVNVMLALEAAFDLEFPDRLLTRGVFQSIASISDALAELHAR